MGVDRKLLLNGMKNRTVYMLGLGQKIAIGGLLTILVKLFLHGPKTKWVRGVEYRLQLKMRNDWRLQQIADEVR